MKRLPLPINTYSSQSLLLLVSYFLFHQLPPLPLLLLLSSLLVLVLALLLFPIPNQPFSSFLTAPSLPFAHLSFKFALFFSLSAFLLSNSFCRSARRFLRSVVSSACFFLIDFIFSELLSSFLLFPAKSSNILFALFVAFPIANILDGSLPIF